MKKNLYSLRMRLIMMTICQTNFLLTSIEIMAMNILITGANGQLGNEMQLVLKDNADFKFFTTDVAELDITDKSAIDRYIQNNDIKLIINCAAYTAVDKAEDDIELCTKLNIEAPENLASLALKYGTKLIHISTDYVFNGLNHKPYNEDDIPNPDSVYGSTKLAGERAIQSILPNAIIIRTSWLYSVHGRNFVKTMLELGKTKESLKVVADQVGTPTYAGDLAQAIYQIISSGKWIPGIYHFSNEGACSWYDFTKVIHHMSGIKDCKVFPVPSSEYPTKAKRPFYSVLDKGKIKKSFGIEIPFWMDSLEKCLKALNCFN